MENNFINIEQCPNAVDFHTGKVNGHKTIHTVKYLNQLSEIFEDKESFEKLDQTQIAYEVDCHMPVDQGIQGGLFFGTSYIHPGRVGEEYFMTSGHFHENLNSAEYYWGIVGKGILLLMDEQGECIAQKVEAGSLHYIPGAKAHRLVNIGEDMLVVGACWPSDAGHDYETIKKNGFTAKVIFDGEKPIVVRNNPVKD